MSNNLVSCNNLAVNQNLTVNGSITSSGEIQTTGNISCSNITSSGLASISANNINISGTINGIVNLSNLLSLDTTSSIKTSLNTINTTLATKANDSAVVHNTGTETIAGLKTFSSNVACPALLLNGVDLNTRLTTDEANITSLSNRLSIDVSGNVALRTTNTNTGLNVGVNNGSSLYINSNGKTTIKNNGGLNDVVLSVSETTSNKVISIIPNCGPGALNNITKPNGSVLASDYNTPLSLTQKCDTGASGIVIEKDSLLLGSGSLTTLSPQNYLYINNGGIGLNKQTPAYPLDINGNVRVNDLYFSNFIDPIIGNNTCSLSERWTALYGSLQNDINVSATNSTNITTLQSQIASLTTQLNNLYANNVKAYGFWDRSTNTMTIGNQFIQNSPTFDYQTLDDPLIPIVQGVKIILNSNITSIKGIIQVTPALFGYTAHVFNLSLSSPFTFVVQSQGGGSQPVIQNNSFYWSVI